MIRNFGLFKVEMVIKSFTKFKIILIDLFMMILKRVIIVEELIELYKNFFNIFNVFNRSLNILILIVTKSLFGFLKQ